MDNIAEIRKYFTRRGPCAFCGNADANHRMFDAVFDRCLRAGESVHEVAYDCDISIDAVFYILREYDRDAGVLEY